MRVLYGKRDEHKIQINSFISSLSSSLSRCTLRAVLAGTMHDQFQNSWGRVKCLKVNRFLEKRTKCYRETTLDSWWMPEES